MVLSVLFPLADSPGNRLRCRSSLHLIPQKAAQYCKYDRRDYKAKEGGHKTLPVITYHNHRERYRGAVAQDDNEKCASYTEGRLINVDIPPGALLLP